MFDDVQDGDDGMWRRNPSGETHTFAHGLAAPYAGRICFEHVKKFVDGCVLVTDAELAAATKFMYQHGIVAETSGCAAVAAVMWVIDAAKRDFLPPILVVRCPF